MYELTIKKFEKQITLGKKKKKERKEGREEGRKERKENTQNTVFFD